MLIYAHICSYMHIYDHTCAYMRIYAHKCAYMRIYAHICAFMRIYVQPTADVGPPPPGGVWYPVQITTGIVRFLLCCAANLHL